MLRPRSSLDLFLTHCGEAAAARRTPNQIEDELHFGRSRFVVVNENTWLFVSRWLRPLREKVSFGI